MFTNLFNNYNYKRHLKRIVITTLIFLMSIVPTFASVGPMDVSDNTTHVRLQTIINTLTNIYSRQATTNTYIQNIINKITGVTGDTYQSWNIHQLLSKIATNTNSISNSAALTDQKVEQIYYSVDQVESYLTNIKDYTNILNSIDSDLKINWTSCCNFLGVRKSYDGEYISPGAPNSTIGQSYAYAVYKLNNNFNSYVSSNIFRVYVPLAGYWDPNRNGSYTINMYIRYPHNGNRYFFTPDDFNYVQLYNGILITFTGITPMWSGSEFIIGINNSYDNGPLLYYSTSPFFDYIPMTDQSYFDGISSLYLNSINKNINKITELYASDDLIAAKENQQNYEDSVISDFTGSGSAAASTSDSSNLKNISSSIKSGLDAGGSVNGVLGVFNTSGGLWDWFSQSNYNEINGTQNNRLMRGSDEYIDFYNTNYEELQRLLLEESR